MPYPPPQVPGSFFSQTPYDTQPTDSDLQHLQQDDSARAGHAPLDAGGVATGGGHPFSAHAPGLEGSLQQATSPQRLAQGVLTMDEAPTPPQNISATPDQQSMRRKPKNTKACDECRRKKIRCDMQSETGDPDNPCSACRRTGLRCQSSRQQMKRGPSKGYIKELAERLNLLESQVGPQAAQLAFSPQASTSAQGLAEQDPFEEATASSLKRTYAQMQGAPALQTNQMLNDRGSQDQPFDISSAASPRPPPQPTFEATNSNSSLWRFGSTENHRRETVGLPYGPDSREQESEALQDWNEAVVDEYYRLIHQTFPLLPHSKLRLRSRLFHCPPTLREAFLTALDTAIKGAPTSHFSSLDNTESARKAAALIAASQFGSTSNRTMSANIIYIQTLILMALESDHHGPATMRGQVGPPRAEWLGRAVGMAMHLKLNTLYPKDRYGEGDPDADEKLGRRVWWILFILDRWHASSTSQLLQLPENSSSLLLEDLMLLGESTYHLARLSYILGHLSAILQQPPSLMARESAAAPIITTTILGELDRFRESVESVLLGAPNLVHLSYWHVRLMVLRLTPSTSVEELLVPATRMASILNSSHTAITPLNHHFAALATMTLCELADFDETRDGARKGLEDVAEAVATNRGFQAREDSTGWDGAIQELVGKRRAQLASSRPGTAGGSGGSLGSLRHLADAAQGSADGEDGFAGESTSRAFDPTVTTRYGYLAALVQEGRM